jgi:hypothetical protein
MATFEVLAKRILELVPIENADAIELARIDGFYSVVRKNQFSVGQIVLYLPEQAVVPENILQAINLWDYEKGKGKLTAASGAVIKAIKLRGQLSQGIVVDEEVLQTILNDKTFNLVENQDYQETFNITKHVVPIPEHMAGEVFNLGLKIDFDLENIQKYPNVINDDEDVVIITEKLHGCKVYSSQVQTLEFGILPIGKIVEEKLNVSVKSFNHEIGLFEYQQVTNYFEDTNNQDWYEIITEDGNKLIITGEDSVWLPEFGCYRKVKDLKINDRVLTDN